VLFLSARGLWGLRRERARQQTLSAARRVVRLAPHVFWIACTLIMVTLVGPALAGRGFDLRWFTGFYPDIALLAGVVLAAETVQLLFKAVVALTLPPPPA